MTDLIIYLIKVSACLFVLFGVYYLNLRYFTFHTANRLCLIAIIAGSFIVPFVPVTQEFNDELAMAIQIEKEASGELELLSIPAESTIQTDSNSFWNLVVILYALGVVLFSFRFVSSLFTLHKLGFQSVVEKRGGFRIKRTNEKTSYTFFNTIFLPYGHTDEIILQHEKTHAKQFHWMDLFFAELAAIILWFNPVIFLVKRELKLQHEFLADRSVLNHGISFERYAQCLIKNMAPAISTNAISPLRSTSIKNRIHMMTKKETSRYLLFIYLLLIPACAILLMSFGRKAIATGSDAPTLPEITLSQTPGIAPVDLSKVTRIVMYGDRIHPATQKQTKHTGIDFQLPLGSDVVATGDGVVVIQEYGDKQGNYVVIRHDETMMTRYYHLQKALVKNGDKVSKGQVIGLIGSTGAFSTGPHLHYEVIKNGTDVDPKDYLPALPGL